MNKLTPLQLFTIMICGTCYSFMTHFPFTQDNIQWVMISMAVSAVVQFILVLPAAVLKEKFPEENVCSVLIRKNRFWGISLILLYTLVFLGAVFSLVGNFAYYIEFYFSSFIPQTLIVLSCVFAAIYLGAMRTNIISKTAFSAMLLFVIFTFAVIVGSYKKIGLDNFNIAQENYGGAFFRGIKSDFALSWDLVLFVFLLNDLKGKGKNAIKTAGIYFGAKLVALEIILAFITMILGDYGRFSKLSFFLMASYSSSSFIQRFDAAFLFLWVVMALVKISAFIHCGSRGLKEIFPKIPFKTCGIICGIMPSLAAVALLITDKWKSTEYFLNGMWLQWLLIGIIPLAVLIFMGKEKNRESS